MNSQQSPLSLALSRAREFPDDSSAWDEVEAIAAEEQAPEPVAELYAELLSSALPVESRKRLGARATRFCDEWFADDAPEMQAVLLKLFELDKSSEQTFDRLSIGLTARGNWDSLLQLYAQAVDATDSIERKTRLLDEAVRIAKDLAKDDGQAIEFLKRLVALRPTDFSLRGNLERLFERHGRYRELVGLMDSGCHLLEPADAAQVKVQIATLWLEKLENPHAALEVLSKVLEGDPRQDEAMALAERILMSDAAIATRRSALSLLTATYARIDRPLDAARVTRAGAAFARGEELENLHLTAATLFRQQGLEGEALVDLGALFALRPEDAELAQDIAGLALQLDAHDQHTGILERAAEHARSRARAAELTLTAAHVARDRVMDADRAIRLYQKVFSDDTLPELAREAGAALDALLDQKGRGKDRIAVLGRLAELSEDPARERELLGKHAQLSAEQGDVEQAVATWRRCLASDPADKQALDALVSLLEASGEFGALVLALRKRAHLLGGREGGRDLARIAAVYAKELKNLESALSIWEELHGEAPDLFEELEVGPVLDAAAESESSRGARVLSGLGDAYTRFVGDPARAFRYYSRALAQDPRLTTARTGLASLLEVDAVRGQAAEALASAYKVTGEEGSLLELVPHRLHGASDSARRAELLREAAQVAEHRLDAPDKALAHAIGALIEQPLDAGADARILRLAKAQGAVDALADGLGRAAERLDPDHARFGELKALEGKLREEELGAAAPAFEAYSLAAKARPGDHGLSESVCRTAVGIGRYDAAVTTLLEVAAREDSVPVDLWQVIESGSQDAAGYAEVAREATQRLDAVELSTEVRRGFLVRLAEWEKGLCGSFEAAEALLVKAARLGGEPHLPTLRKLVTLERERPGPLLFDTLVEVAGLDPHDLDALVEAHSVARERLEDPSRAKLVLERAFDRARDFVAQGRAASGEHKAERVLATTAEALADALGAEGAHARAVEVLKEASRLRIAPEAAHGFALRAAELAAGQLSDAASAVALYERALELSPDEASTWSALAVQCARLGRLDEQLSALRRELSLSRDVGRRLELRLEVAKVVGEIEARGARMAALRDNLAESPGHEATLVALIGVLRERGLLEDVYAVLAEQAEQLVQGGDAGGATALWKRGALFADRELADPERALVAYQKVAELGFDEEALTALARIHLARKEPALAAPWIARRLSAKPPEERAQLRLSLADTYRAVGSTEQASECLREGVAEAPDAFLLRDALAQAYEDAGRTEDLAVLLADSALRARGQEQLLDYARRAATLFCDVLGEPSRALEVLARAVEADPVDRKLKAMHADSLAAAGRLDEARQVLSDLVSAFGRRRSPERAEIHLRLSKVCVLSGNLPEALSELDAASSMDRTNVLILGSLGDLAFEAGELERAERAYRALLMAVRASAQQGATPAMGTGEAVYRLYRIAQVQKDQDKARELLESMIQAAVDDEGETARLKKLLLSRGENELLLRVLTERLARVQGGKPQAEVLTDLADVLEQVEGRGADALEHRLRAVGCAPESEAVHEAAARLSKALGREAAYVEALRGLIERARRKEDAGLVSDLAVRAGMALEHSPEAAAEAQKFYECVAPGTSAYTEALFGLARLADRQGDAGQQRSLLRQIADLPEHADYAQPKRDAEYRLIELELLDEHQREAGLDKLFELLKKEPDFNRAGAILKAASEADPSNARILEALETLARRSGDQRVLLSFVERQASSGSPSLDLIREGVDIARALAAPERAERLLESALAASGEQSHADRAWVATQLARLRRERGDVAGAMDCYEQAMAVTDSADAFDLGLELAAYARDAGGDRARAEAVYELLRERDPADRRVWSALFDLYKEKGHLDKIQGLVQATVETLLDPNERNALRVEAARMLFSADREEEGAKFLHDVLAEDPDHQEATLTLADLYERRGENEALAELLRQRLDGAIQKGSPSIVPLSLRMGNLLAPTRPDQAVDLYREALGIAPDSAPLQQALIGLLDAEHDAEERAALVERYLEGEGKADAGAAQLALWLVDQRIATENEAAFPRAYDLAKQLGPSGELSTRAERWYRDREDYPRLAQWLEEQAAQQEDGEHAFALWMEAADIHLDRLSAPEAAAAVLRRARERHPGDFALLTRTARAFFAAGNADAALSEIDGALAAGQLKQGQQVELLLLKAEVANSCGRETDALQALEAAYATFGEPVREALTSALDQARERAREQGTTDRERELMAREVGLLLEAGRMDTAIELLSAWVLRMQDDVEALKTLFELQRSEENWADAVPTGERLMCLADREELPALGRQLLDAAREFGDLRRAAVGLEQGLQRFSDLEPMVDLLSEIYEATDNKRALAELLSCYLSESDPPEKKFERLRRIGQLLLDAGEVAAALAALTKASQLKPDDVPTVLFIADAHIAAERFQQAQDLLEVSMNAFKQRRSPELSLLRQRMAKLARAAGDLEACLEWLNAAMDADMSNGDVLAELAVLAHERGELELALKALRGVTLLKTECPMSRAEAFYRQALIVLQKGERKRAVLWAKKAKAEDPELPGIDDLLSQLGQR